MPVNILTCFRIYDNKKDKAKTVAIFFLNKYDSVMIQEKCLNRNTDNNLGLNVRKPVFWGLQTTQAQTSLRIHAV